MGRFTSMRNLDHTLHRPIGYERQSYHNAEYSPFVFILFLKEPVTVPIALLPNNIPFFVVSPSENCNTRFTRLCSNYPCGEKKHLPDLRSGRNLTHASLKNFLQAYNPQERERSPSFPATYICIYYFFSFSKVIPSHLPRPELLNIAFFRWNCGTMLDCEFPGLRRLFQP